MSIHYHHQEYFTERHRQLTITQHSQISLLLCMLLAHILANIIPFLQHKMTNTVTDE